MGSYIQSSSGERTLPNAKIELDGLRIDSSLVKGSKIQWFPRKELSITSKYTQRLSRLFSSVGIRYGDMTVVPRDLLPELQKELEALRVAWEDDVNQLVNDYDQIMDKHVAANADISALIRKFALTKESFKNCFKLTYLRPLAIKPLVEEHESEMAQQVALTMWEEISSDALALYKASWFKEKQSVDRVSQKIKEPLRRLMNKMLTFSFLDERIINVTRTIQDVINKLPSAGYIEGHDFLQLTNWVLILSDHDKLQLHADGTPQFAYENALIEKKEIKPKTSSERSMTTAVPLQQPPATLIETHTLDFGMDW